MLQHDVQPLRTNYDGGKSLRHDPEQSIDLLGLDIFGYNGQEETTLLIPPSGLNYVIN